mgnify:CR=1 FL=1
MSKTKRETAPVDFSTFTRDELNGIVRLLTLQALDDIYCDLKVGDEVEIDKLVAKQNFLSRGSVVGYNKMSQKNGYNSMQKEVTDKSIKISRKRVEKKYVNVDDENDYIVRSKFVKVCEVV